MKRYIPLSIPNFEGNEKKYLIDAIEQGWVSTGGEYINKLERQMENELHVDKVAACQSGTAALHLALIEAGVGDGDIVLVPTLTFIAAVNPVKYQKANPIFMDCDDSLCIDPKKIRQFCQEKCEFIDGRLFFDDKVVKAIIVVHVFGNMADMEEIMEIAQHYNLIVIEDASEALGTKYIKGKYNGRYAGTIGHFGAFSFNGNKIITTGGGGAITSNNPERVNHIKYLSTQAKDDPLLFLHNEVGYNYRMTNLQAAVGVAQMEKLQEYIKRKQNNYLLYKKCFQDFDLAELLEFRNDVYSNKWFYSLIINCDIVGTDMIDIIRKLDAKGIQTRAIWGLINFQKPYCNDYAYKIEKSVYYSQRILNIPCSTQITKEEIMYTADTIKNLLMELKNE